MKNQIIYEDKYLNIKNNFLSKLSFDKNLDRKKKKNWTILRRKKHLNETDSLKKKKKVFLILHKLKQK